MKVLIAIDGSECSSAAVQSVMERDWPDGTEFTVLSVVDPPFAEYGLLLGPENIRNEMHRQHSLLVSSDVAILKNRFLDHKVTGMVLDGNVRLKIIETACELGADLIVMGSHGRTGWSKLALGSIAEGVLSMAPCSVEIIKQKAKVA